MHCLLDTYAWIELLRGTAQGSVVRKLIKNKKNSIVLLDASFAELYSWTVREGHDVTQVFPAIRSLANVIETDPNLWVLAAHRKEEQRAKRPGFGLVDGLVLAAAEFTHATIVTGDPHFKEIKGVVFLG